jgi:TRAP-type C4-dicarboxylate transport system permease small subunit
MRTLHARLLAAGQRVNRACGLLTGAILAAIVLANGAEILLRSTVSYSIAWVFEVNTLLATWLYFIGICQVYFRKGDIAVDFLARRMPPRVQRAWSATLLVLSMLTLAVIAWHGALLMQVQWPYRTPGVRLPSAAFTLPVVLGAVIMMLHLATHLGALLARPGAQGGTDGGRA